MTARFATLQRQCLLFAIGSSFFALATVPGFPALAGAGATNTLCFVGSWFFTTAAGMQLVLAVGMWSPKSVDWQAAWINLAGCAAFGVSALAAFVRKTGVTVDERLANFGTFVGALCFLVAALLVQPRRSRWFTRVPGRRTAASHRE